MNILHIRKVLRIDETREGAFKLAMTVLANAKRRHIQVGQHRAISRLPLGPYLFLQALFLPLGFCASLLWAKPFLLEFWHDCILIWANILDIPLATAVDKTGLGLGWLKGDTSSYFPSKTLWLLTFVATTLAFIASFKMNRASIPLKYLTRILCTVQGLSLLYFLLLPNQFPYTITSHLIDMTDTGFMLLSAIPVMLALGYYVLDFSLVTKIRNTILILAYFVIMIPHQTVLHVLLLQHFSLLFMPLLYFCFGALFDVLIFVALYSWAASAIPVEATK